MSRRRSGDEGFGAFYQRRGLMVFAIGFLGLIAIGAALLAVLPGSGESTSNRVIDGAVALGLVAACIYAGRRLAKNDPLFSLSEVGIEVPRVGSLRWEEVAGVTRYSMRHSRMLAISPKERTLEALTRRKRRTNRFDSWYLGRRVWAVLSLTGMSKPAREALEEALARHEIPTLELKHRGFRRLVRVLLFFAGG